MENRKRSRLLKALILLGLLACLAPMGRTYSQSLAHRAQQNSLKEAVIKSSSVLPKPDSLVAEKDSASVSQVSGGQDTQEAGEETQETSTMLAKYASLYEENNDLAGWLSIEGMKIDYPVMQCGDDEYYLSHDFYGEESKYGCLYVRNQADLEDGANFLIYGHNMRDGAMFGDLDLYQEESFYKEHPTVSFHTLYEERTYDIIAVFRSQVYRVDEDVFKYYKFYEANTREEFEDFYSNVKALSLYDTGVEAEFGDTFLTLSTCAYHVEDGRFVVVARRRE